MLQLNLAKITANKGSRVSISIADGFGEFETTTAYLVAPGGAAQVQTWMPPAVGDQVLVISDSDRPDLPYVMGTVWTDKQSPSITAPDQVLLKAPGGVTLVDSSGAQPITRDDRLQNDLNAIKSALDALANQIATHTHAVAGVVAGPAAVTSAPSGVGSNAYSPGSTACDLVKGV